MTTPSPSPSTTTTTIGAAAPDGAPAKDGAVDTKPVDAKPDQAALDKSAADADALPFSDIAQLGLEKDAKYDESGMKDLLAFAKDNGINTKQARGLLALDAKRAAAAQTARESARDAATKAAVESLKSDKEFGGAKFEASMKAANLALNYLGFTKGSDELNELTGIELADGSLLGDSAILARIMVRLGGKVAEDKGGARKADGTPKTAANDPATMQRSMYPKTTTLKFG